MHLVLVGTSHHRAPVELREQLYVSTPENPELVRRLAGEEGEAVALSTCNRMVIAAVCQPLAERPAKRLSFAASSSR